MGYLKLPLFTSIAVLCTDNRRSEPWVVRELEDKVNTFGGVGGTIAVHKDVVLHSKKGGFWPPEGGR